MVEEIGVSVQVKLMVPWKEIKREVIPTIKRKEILDATQS